MVAEWEMRAQGRAGDDVCVMLVDRFLPDGIWSFAGVILSAVIINTELNIHQLKELSYSCGHVDSELTKYQNGSIF